MPRNAPLASLILIALAWSGRPTAAAPLRASTTVARTSVRDVALTATGSLRGQVVQRQGEPRVGVRVKLQTFGRVLTEAVTDLEGRFEFTNVRSGHYLIFTDESYGQFRVWSAHTAPPRATDAALLFAQQRAVRGQSPSETITELALPAALIGIPLAIGIAQGGDSDSGNRVAPPASDN